MSVPLHEDEEAQSIDKMVVGLVAVALEKASNDNVPVSHIANLIESLSSYITAGGGEESGLMRLIEKLDEQP